MHTRLVTLLAAAVLATSAWGNVKWKDDYDKAIQEAKERNCPIFITFHKDG